MCQIASLTAAMAVLACGVLTVMMTRRAPIGRPEIVIPHVSQVDSIACNPGGTQSANPIGRPRAWFRRDEAAELRKSGLSWRHIASKLKVGITAVRRAGRDGSSCCQKPPGRNL